MSRHNLNTGKCGKGISVLQNSEDVRSPGLSSNTTAKRENTKIANCAIYYQTLGVLLKSTVDQTLVENPKGR